MSISNLRKASLGVCAAILLSSASAFGTITTYTSSAAWIAAVNNIYLTETFDATGLKPFTGVTTTEGVIGPARGVLTGSVWTDRVVPAAETTTFSYKLGQIVGASGTFDTSPGGEGTGLVFLDVITAGNQTVSQIGPIDGGFFGWTSTVPFQSFQISAGTNAGSAETYDLDNLNFALAVPEPASLSILGIVGAISLGRRRR